MTEISFYINNHKTNPDVFLREDMDLRHLQSKRYVFEFEQLSEFPVDKPDIYTLSGGFLTGKTTLLKMWMKKLLDSQNPPVALAFFSAELILNYHDLYKSIKKMIQMHPKEGLIYLIVDNISNIRNWKKPLTSLIEEDALKQSVLMLSSPEVTFKQEIQKDFGIYRDQSHKLDFTLSFLAFNEVVSLKKQPITPDLLRAEFNNYLIHGGCLDAINDMETGGYILDSTFSRYADKLRKALIKQDKQERFLREILQHIFKNYLNSTTWNILARELSIDHPKTISNYFNFLESLDCVFVQYALLEKTLTFAPKKARKPMFNSPFIFHAIEAWLNPVKNYHQNQISRLTTNSELLSRMVKACVISHYHRYYPTYYIKAEGEVDLVYLYDKELWPIEITWIIQLRAKDLKQILKYPNGRIFTQTEQPGVILHITTEWLPQALYHFQLKDKNQEEKTEAVTTEKGIPLLIIDDNPINLKLEKILMLGEGYDVRTAMDAEEALKLLESFQPRLIIMDLQLPGMSGLELTKILKSNPKYAEIIILAVTAYAMKGDKEKALAAGCDGYIAKPIDIKTFPSIIKNYLS